MQIGSSRLLKNHCFKVAQIQDKSNISHMATRYGFIMTQQCDMILMEDESLTF